MDSRAKQRLTGAIILVALFVLLVPELLTGPRSDAPAPAAPADDGLRRYTIDLDAPAPNVAPKSSSASPPAVALPPIAENPVSDAPARALPGEAAKPQVPAPQATPPPAAARPVAPVAVAPKPVAPPVATTPTSRSPAVASGAFAVQLGSFSVRDNADQLVREMTAKGFNAFVAPITTSGGRELYRVRVGPTRDRAAAEALAAQLRRIGHTGSSIVPIS
jgi:DedD protein